MSFVLFERDGELFTQPNERDPGGDPETEVIIRRDARILREGSPEFVRLCGRALPRRKKLGAPKVFLPAESPDEFRDRALEIIENRATVLRAGAVESDDAAVWEVVVFSDGTAVILRDRAVAERRERAP